MIERIFEELCGCYRPGEISKPLTIYFSVDEIKKTVTLGPGCCRVEDGKTTEMADCVCKLGTEMLHRIWDEGYRPGVGDFLSGRIRSNKPEILQGFLRACQRSG